MIEIDARCVIFNMMLFNNSIKLSQLPIFAAEFSRRVPSSYVDISDNAIFDIIDRYPDTLIFKDNIISRGEFYGLFGEQSFIDRTINREFSMDVRKYLYESVKEINNVAL